MFRFRKRKKPVQRWNQLPRCIAGFNTEPVVLRGIALDGHAPVDWTPPRKSKGKVHWPRKFNTAFRLYCSCGSGTGYVYGHNVTNPAFGVTVFVGPLSYRCDSCGTTIDLIDTDIHGYDPEVCGLSCTIRGSGEPESFKCEVCGQVPMEIWVRFEYSDDDSPEFAEEYGGRGQDLFTWFTALGQCSGCSRLYTIADFECA